MQKRKLTAEGMRTTFIEGLQTAKHARKPLEMRWLTHRIHLFCYGFFEVDWKFEDHFDYVTTSTFNVQGTTGPLSAFRRIFERKTLSARLFNVARYIRFSLLLRILVVVDRT